MDNRDRYIDLMDLIAELRRDMQTYQQRADAERKAQTDEIRMTRQDLSTQMLTYWQGTAAALRQLSDWRVDDETLARKERAEERIRRSWRDRLIICLLILVLAVAVWGYVLL